jgi:hypothetical protein
MKATIEQLAWYIERDGGTVSFSRGEQIISVPALGGTITYAVPAFRVDELNAARDRVYRTLAEKRRAAAR